MNDSTANLLVQLLKNFPPAAPSAVLNDFNECVAIIRDIEDQRDNNIAKNTSLSAQGKADALKKFAGTLATRFMQLVNSVDTWQIRINSYKAALFPTIDAKDAAAMALRNWYRDRLIVLDQGSRENLFNKANDSGVALLALTEVSNLILGMSERDYDRLKELWLKANKAKDLADFAVLQDSFNVLTKVYSMALRSLCDAAGIVGANNAALFAFLNANASGAWKPKAETDFWAATGVPAAS